MVALATLIDKLPEFRRMIKALLAVMVVGTTLGLVAYLSYIGQVDNALKILGAMGLLSKVVMDEYFKDNGP